MINLLPPHYKNELRREEQFRVVLMLGMLLMVFFVCLFLSLLSIRVYMSGEIQAQQIFVESERKEAGESRLEQIRQLNSSIARISSFYSNRVTLSDIITRISDALPESSYLTSFNYAQGNIALEGFSPQTEDLLQFRTNLEQDSLFENFHFPPSNWIQPTDIDFAFDFEI